MLGLRLTHAAIATAATLVSTVLAQTTVDPIVIKVTFMLDAYSKIFTNLCLPSRVLSFSIRRMALSCKEH